MLRRDYGYDVLGNISSISNLVYPAKDQSFRYDKLGRLTEASGAYGDVSYTYDEIGNRLSKTFAGYSSTEYLYVSGTNKLDSTTGAEVASYSYDTDGNLTSDGTYDYEYTNAVGKGGYIAQLYEANLYRFVMNNPINKIDYFGLSEEDVTKIHSTYHYAIEEMYSRGVKHWYPYWNNVSRSLYELSWGFLGSRYYGCGEQEDFLKDKLEQNTYDDEWDFEWQGKPFPPHQWLKAVSSNPDDPVITMDPWKDNINDMPAR